MDPYGGMDQNPMHYPQGNMQGPPPNGQPPNVMVPQFSFRTLLRFVTELVAVIQGVAMIMAMVTGWLKDQQTGEPGPLGKFFTAVRKRVMQFIFGASWSSSPAKSMDSAWAAASQRPNLSWTQRVIGLYLAYAVILELKNYWQTIKHQPTGQFPVSAPNGPRPGMPPSAQDDGAPGGNLLEFYVNKQRELYQKRKAQEEAVDLMEMGGPSDME